MGEPVYHTESYWQTQQNQEFQALLHQMGTYKTSGQQVMFLQLMFAFMSNYYEGLGNSPRYKMAVDQGILSNMSTIANAFQQVGFSHVDGSGISTPEQHQLVTQAYEAANGVLFELYTNPIYQGSEIPGEVLSDFCTIFVIDPRSTLDGGGVTWTKTSVEVDDTQESVNVPSFANTNNGEVNWTVTIWCGNNPNGNPNSGESPYAPYQPGDPGYQAWLNQMQTIQGKIQTVNTIFTDDTPTQQAIYKFDVSELKEFNGAWSNNNKNVTQLQQTEIQAEVRN